MQQYNVSEKRFTTPYGLDLSYQFWSNSDALCLEGGAQTTPRSENERGEPLRIITLHGWLDNAASFQRLASTVYEVRSASDEQTSHKRPSPKLDMAVLDLPGHGLSGHRHLQATYNLWDDIRDILALADSLGWSSFVLMGHSRGAMISVLLSAAVPERVSALVLLDGSIPADVPAEDAPAQLAKHLRDHSRIRDLEDRKKGLSYASLEDAVAARVKATGLTECAARLLVERGLKENGDGRFVWRADSRLRGASAVRFSQAQGLAFLRAIQCPVLLIMALQGLGSQSEHVELLEGLSNIDLRLLPGGHHFHMESEANVLAELICNFLVNQL
jgi:pimeloyl-ACP methyl ester carboxylesterase